MVLVVALVLVLILVFVLLLILTISANVRCWRPSSEGVRVGDDGFVVVVEVAAEVDELMVDGWVVIGDDWE